MSRHLRTGLLLQELPADTRCWFFLGHSKAGDFLEIAPESEERNARFAEKIRGRAGMGGVLVVTPSGALRFASPTAGHALLARLARLTEEHGRKIPGYRRLIGAEAQVVPTEGEPRDEVVRSPGLWRKLLPGSSLTPQRCAHLATLAASLRKVTQGSTTRFWIDPHPDHPMLLLAGPDDADGTRLAQRVVLLTGGNPPREHYSGTLSVAKDGTFRFDAAAPLLVLHQALTELLAHRKRFPELGRLGGAQIDATGRDTPPLFLDGAPGTLPARASQRCLKLLPEALEHLGDGKEHLFCFTPRTANGTPALVLGTPTKADLLKRQASAFGMLDGESPMILGRVQQVDGHLVFSTQTPATGLLPELLVFARSHASLCPELKALKGLVHHAPTPDAKNIPGDRDLAGQA